MKVLFVYPRFQRHAEAHPELLDYVPMNEYLGSPSLGIAMIAASTPDHVELEFRDDRLHDAGIPTDADIVAMSFFTPAATRALELADYFKGQGKIVVAGGIFPTMMPDVVQRHVDSVFVGEGEGAWRRFLKDHANGEIKPRYHAEDVALGELPDPRLDLYFDQECDRFMPDDYPLQISRGCALSCHACVLPTSMTRKLRCFSLEQNIRQLEQLAARGRKGCLTEDTSWFPGHKGKRALEALLDYIIESGTRASISYIGISLPMILCTPVSFFDKAKRAGVDMFYLVGGFDPITMNAFTGKDPKAYKRGIDAIQKAWDVGIEPYTSFLLGGDQDDLGTVDRMLEFADVSGIRKAEFAIATPYPGTPQWHKLVSEDRILHRDWSRYNDANVTFRPAQMTADELQDGYLRLWREFYRGRQHLGDLDKGERTIQF
ncbi:MAG: radical SAM superfamily enzyme YgiQ (UPF0313 family) [Kiritimatiellia bacterium]|jgi:radical SAM superfamily enzyme YgiQ (UPF0313 family)